jgi:hypothetical protein
MEMKQKEISSSIVTTIISGHVSNIWDYNCQNIKLINPFDEKIKLKNIINVFY